MKKEIIVFSDYDGGSCGYLAFKKLGVNFKYFAVEKSAAARKLSDNNCKGIIRPANNVFDIGARQFLKELPLIDFFIMGPPCQTVSNMGDGTGLEGESGLLFEGMEHLALAKYRNPNMRILIENVKMKEEFLKQYSFVIGLKPILINSSLLGAQMRERYYFTNYRVGQPKDKGIKASSILETDGQLVKYSESNRYELPNGKRVPGPIKGVTERVLETRAIPADKALTLTTGWGCGAEIRAINKVQEKDGSLRHLTVRECARLQNIPDSYDFSCVSERQAYKMIGNGWDVDTIAHVAKGAL